MKRPKRSSDESSSFDAADRALARYDDVARVASTCRPGTCLDALDALVDVDEYLRLLALMTMVRSGDYVDEVWFYASEELVGARWRFRAHAWDPDDAFQACHHDGENALEDPNGILYCAEGRLDVALLRDEAVYAAFVDALEWTLREGMREETVDAIAETQLEEMFALLSDDDTAAGLAELVALKPENAIAANAREDIRGSMRWYLWLMRERRRLLLRRVAAYRSARADRRRVAIRERTEPRRVVDEDANEGDFDAFAFASSSKTFHVESKDASLTFGPVRVSASAAGVTASATLREHAYDADAAQELIASDFRLRNDGEGTVYLGDGPGPTTTLRFSPTVVYDERAYAAWPETFRVACWRNAWDAGEDRDAAKKPKRVASETSGKCAVRVRTIARDANANANDGVVEDESNATALVSIFVIDPSRYGSRPRRDRTRRARSRSRPDANSSSRGRCRCSTRIGYRFGGASRRKTSSAIQTSPSSREPGKGKLSREGKRSCEIRREKFARASAVAPRRSRHSSVIQSSRLAECRTFKTYDASSSRGRVRPIFFTGSVPVSFSVSFSAHPVFVRVSLLVRIVGLILRRVGFSRSAAHGRRRRQPL